MAFLTLEDLQTFGSAEVSLCSPGLELSLDGTVMLLPSVTLALRL